MKKGWEMLLKKIINILKEPFDLSGPQVNISGSLGITIFPNDGRDLQTLLRNADIAMYKSKQSGKNCSHFYSEDMQKDTHKRMQLQADMRIAMQENHFQMFYQPILESDTREIAVCEALIRWIHIAHGYISPAEFIPIAGESGLIIELGEWVLKTASKQLMQWQDEGHSSLTMSINISSIQFKDKSFLNRLSSILAEAKLDNHNIILEITESILIDNDD
jgi:predicted signal transduction protein with EAL and GGDEF domain